MCFIHKLLSSVPRGRDIANSRSVSRRRHNTSIILIAHVSLAQATEMHKDAQLIRSSVTPAHMAREAAERDNPHHVKEGGERLEFYGARILMSTQYTQKK